MKKDATTHGSLAFSALILATVIAVLDISAVNLALPIIAQDLKLSIGDALWLSKANLLACAVAILPCSALGDVIGHRRCLFAGLSSLALASLGCAVSSELWLLITLRALQGCAGAAIMCSTLVLLREIYPANKLGTALGLNALFVAVTTTSAPAISGLILSFASWRWLFVIGPALALGALLIGYRHVPDKHIVNSRFDWLGSLLIVLIASILLLWHIQQAPALLLISVPLLLGFFIYQQHRSRWAVLPIKLFKNLRFSYSLASSSTAFIGQSAVFITLPITLQKAMGHGPLMTALLFLPWPLATAIVGPWAGRLADRKAPRLVASFGLLILSLGFAALACLPPHAEPLELIWRTALCGIGFGFFQSPNNREILTSAGSAYTARASALLSASRLLGQALGAMLVGLYIAAPPELMPGVGPAGEVANLFRLICILQLCVLGIWSAHRIATHWLVLNTAEERVDDAVGHHSEFDSACRKK